MQLQCMFELYNINKPYVNFEIYYHKITNKMYHASMEGVNAPGPR